MDKSIEQLSQDLARAQYAENTRRNYKRAAEALRDHFAKPIAAITREELREYVQHLTDMGQSVSMLHVTNHAC